MMNILSIDTSSPNATVALMSDERLLGEYTISNDRTHSQIIMPMIADMLEKCGKDIKDIDVFAVAKGPGSFTGLRIGIATAKAFAQANSKKIIGISSLMSLAYNLNDIKDKYICPVIDARRDHVYNAVYMGGNTVKEDRTLHIDELLNELKGKKAVFLGDGVFIHREKILSASPDFKIAPQKDLMQRASSLCQLAYDLINSCNDDSVYDNIHTFEPIYLRKSQAEREYEKNHKEN